VTYFGSEHQETYRCTELEEAVSEELEDASTECELIMALDEMAWPMIIVEVKPMVISPTEIIMLADSALENLLDGLDETYGDPGGDYTNQSVVMKNAARAFVSDVVSAYHVWACEECGRHEVSREQALAIMK